MHQNQSRDIILQYAKCRFNQPLKQTTCISVLSSRHDSSRFVIQRTASKARPCPRIERERPIRRTYLFLIRYDYILLSSIVLAYMPYAPEPSISIYSLRVGGRKQGCGLYYKLWGFFLLLSKLLRN